MILDAACAHFGETSNWHMTDLLPEPIELDVSAIKDDLKYWQAVFSKHHDIWEDHSALLKIMGLDDKQAGSYFDSLRRVYPERFEYQRYRLSGVKKKQPRLLVGCFLG